jgi:hypothetical protein
MVFDLTGVHRLVVRYCLCDGAPSRCIQLLRTRWFPATTERPSTAFAFDILNFFHKLQNQNKCNPYDFYHAIIQRTDAAGLNPEIVHFYFSSASSPPPADRFSSIGTTRLPLCFVSGPTSTCLNEVVPHTVRMLPNRYLMEVSRSHVLPAHNRGRILLNSPSLICTNDFRDVICCCTHPSLLLSL